ncbi:MAG TPA: zf-HC2 domain-containing protein [Vicinamibacterales bacterium]|nr:zf-HC2 domain-containing protein [Vicinamibacterales bacterium]
MARSPSDDPLDRLLTRALSSRATAGGVCPEPELLAAFVDGSLSRTDREQVERHAASCSRCGHILAATVASAPASELPAQGTSLWSGWRAWRWAVPVATAVTVVGVWFASTRPGDLPPPAAKIQDGRVPAPPTVTQPLTSSPAESKPESALSPSGRQEYSAESALAKKERDATEREAVAPPAISAQEARADSQDRAAAVESTQTLADATKQTVTAQPASPPPSRTALEQPAAGAASAAAVARSRAEETMSFVRAPDATVQWRINRGNVIERSTDRGTTWTVEHTASQPLAGGASSSADAAWFFSRGGLVVRRTPGGWVEAMAPAGVQIMSLDATSATQATIRTADGRTFETRDGGASWTER